MIFGTKPEGAKHFPNRLNINNDAVRDSMANAGFQDTAIAPTRLAADPSTPGAWEPVVGRKPESTADTAPDLTKTDDAAEVAAAPRLASSAQSYVPDEELLRQACQEYASLFVREDTSPISPPSSSPAAASALRRHHKASQSSASRRNPHTEDHYFRCFGYATMTCL